MKDRLRVGAWWLLLCVIAWFCVASLFDRLARQGAVAAASPALLAGGNAVMARAWISYRAGDLAAAETLSSAAVWRRPVDAPALRTAGMVAIARGDGPRGDALMRLAGAAGWRDRPTQLYWAEVALAGGEPAVAATRLDAAARTGGIEAAAPLLVRLEASAAGRAALLDRWSVRNRWLPRWLADVRALDERALASRLATIRAIGARLTRADRNGVAVALMERGRTDLAHRLAGAGGRVLAFVAADPGPFDWQIAAAAGLEAAVERRGAALALHVRASGPAVLPLATRLLRLPAGPVRIDAVVDGAATALPLIATVRCLRGGEAIAAPLPSPRGRVAFAMGVPAGCATQRLTLAVTGDEVRRGGDWWLSAPVLSRAAAAP